MGDGDGWVVCHQGHRHWGRFGAAGLLLTDGPRVVLQHRAERTHEGNTWGVPGGARDSHEDPVETALREAGEEAGLEAASIDPIGTVGDDHGGWSYTTVLAAVRGPVEPRAANWESHEIRWWHKTRVDQLALHPGFGPMWPKLRHEAWPLTVVLDVANVVGARPDGWWRDRLAAAARLRAGLATVARDGIAVADLPAAPEGGAPPDHGPAERVLPHLVLVVEGAAAPLATASSERDGAAAPGGTWWARHLVTVAAPASGDDQIVAEAARAPGPVLVVTADRGLRARLDRSVLRAGPQWIYGLLGPEPAPAGPVSRPAGRPAVRGSE